MWLTGCHASIRSQRASNISVSAPPLMHSRRLQGLAPAARLRRHLGGLAATCAMLELDLPTAAAPLCIVPMCRAVSAAVQVGQPAGHTTTQDSYD
jgi:hypothetical protein